MSSLGPEGQGKRGTYLVGLSRPSETTLLYTLVPWSWGKWTQQVFEKPGWVKVNPGQILFGSLKSRIQFLGLEGGLSDEEVSGGPGQGKRIIYIYIYIYIYICWVLYIYIYIYLLVSWGWAKRTPTNFKKPGWVKVNPGQNLFGSTRHVFS